MKLEYAAQNGFGKGELGAFADGVDGDTVNLGCFDADIVQVVGQAQLIDEVEDGIGGGVGGLDGIVLADGKVERGGHWSQLGGVLLGQSVHDGGESDAGGDAVRDAIGRANATAQVVAQASGGVVHLEDAHPGSDLELGARL